MKILAYIGAGILTVLGLVPVVIGVFYMWGSTDPATGKPEWFQIGATAACIGLIMIIAGVVVFILTARKKAASGGENVTLNIELPGNVKMDTLKCESCGGTLKPENIQMVAGAPVVTCPYCGTTYQLTEEPKW
ncbi:MAG: hypothetical protein IMZ61_03775 [Planctomycetes bacterium]|nr:hypothetical protein [Planctomycetota bacterium]